MEKSIIASLLLVASMTCIAQDNPREFIHESNGVTYTMKQYVFCLYLSGAEHSQTEEEAEEIQKNHLAHLGSLQEHHKLVVAGPFGDDTEKRGVLLFDLDTVEEASKLVADDPAVKAKRLDFECHPLWLAKGIELP